MTTQTHPRGNRRVSEKVKFPKIFSRHMPGNGLKRFSPCWQGPNGGGGRPGAAGVRTRDPRHGLGGPCTRKKFLGPGSKFTHSGRNTQRSLDPPTNPPNPQKRGAPSYGGGVRGGGQNQKICWGIILSPTIMILQGVRQPYLAVCYVNDPKNEGYMAPVPALDLTTLFEVISSQESFGRFWVIGGQGPRTVQGHY